MSQIDELINLCRRLIRTEGKYLVLSVPLSDPGEASAGFDMGQARILANYCEELVRGAQGQMLMVESGDIFCVLRREDAKKLEAVQAALQAAMQDLAQQTGRTAAIQLRSFRVPEDYSSLREYTERLSERVSGTGGPEPLRGALTLKVLQKIEEVLVSADLRPLLRRQLAWRMPQGRPAKPLFEEVHVGMNTLKERLFPEVEMDPTSVLHLVFLHLLDLKMLEMVQRGQLRSELPVAVNLTLQTVTGAGFALIASKMEPERRSRLMLELTAGDVLRDPRVAADCIRQLRGLGFTVAVEGLTLDRVAMVRWDRLPVDYLKLILSESDLPALSDKGILAALHALPAERVVLHRLDSAKVMTVGRALGFEQMQGWLVDQLTGAPVAGHTASRAPVPA